MTNDNDKDGRAPVFRVRARRSTGWLAGWRVALAFVLGFLGFWGLWWLGVGAWAR